MRLCICIGIRTRTHLFNKERKAQNRIVASKHRSMCYLFNFRLTVVAQAETNFAHVTLKETERERWKVRKKSSSQEIMSPLPQYYTFHNLIDIKIN